MATTRRLKAKGPERRKLFTTAQPVHVCRDCGKHAYGDRDQAKSVAKTVHRGEKMNVYRCPSGGYFHVGHISPLVKAGVLTRSERYG